MTGLCSNLSPEIPPLDYLFIPDYPVFIQTIFEEWRIYGF